MRIEVPAMKAKDGRIVWEDVEMICWIQGVLRFYQGNVFYLEHPPLSIHPAPGRAIATTTGTDYMHIYEMEVEPR